MLQLLDFDSIALVNNNCLPVTCHLDAYNFVHIVRTSNVGGGGMHITNCIAFSIIYDFSIFHDKLSRWNQILIEFLPLELSSTVLTYNGFFNFLENVLNGIGSKSSFTLGDFNIDLDPMQAEVHMLIL